MFSFGNRASTSELPSSLRNSALLTAGLQATIRGQYIIAGMTGLGMILGAVLAAWLVVQIPGAWNGMMFALPGGWQGVALIVLSWVGRVVGVVMGGIVVSAFFRHITYTVVAKSLMTLKENPAITAEESAWLDFELATMAVALRKSDWTESGVFGYVVGTLVWFGVSFFAITGSLAFTDGIWLMTVQLFVFLAIVITGWMFVFRAPASMLALDFDEVLEKLKTQLKTTETPLAILTHAKPLTDYAVALLVCAVLAVLAGGCARVLDRELQYTAYKENLTAAVRTAKVELSEAGESDRDEILATLGKTQYSGKKVNWAIVADVRASRFKFRDCAQLYGFASADQLAFVCVDGDTSMANLLRDLIQGDLTSAEWARFSYPEPAR